MEICLSLASHARKHFAVRKRCPTQPVVWNTGTNVLVEISFCIKVESYKPQRPKSRKGTTMNKVTAIDDEPDSDGNNVIQITMSDGRTIDAAIDLAAAQTLVQILQRRLVRWADESAKSLRLPQIEVIDAGVAHQGPGAQLMVSTSQMGYLVLAMADEVLRKAQSEIGRVVTFRSGPQSKN
jgi:hypothetical protein